MVFKTYDTFISFMTDLQSLHDVHVLELDFRVCRAKVKALNFFFDDVAFPPLSKWDNEAITHFIFPPWDICFARGITHSTHPSVEII